MVATTKEAKTSRQGASVQGWQTDVERLVGRVRDGWRDGWKGLTDRRNGVINGLVKEVQRFQGDLQKRAELVVRRAEQRTSRVFNTVERGLTTSFSPLIRRLDVASRQDLEKLSSRVEELERRIEHMNKSVKAA
jgi:polyhydroxyalkanoate synthesis regulator phasin